MIQYLCDRCNEKTEKWLITEVTLENKHEIRVWGANLSKPIHLCPKCMDGLIKWIDKD